jgi:hypothetical protein
MDVIYTSTVLRWNLEGIAVLFISRFMPTQAVEAYILHYLVANAKPNHVDYLSSLPFLIEQHGCYEAIRKFSGIPKAPPMTDLQAKAEEIISHFTKSQTLSEIRLNKRSFYLNLIAAMAYNYGANKEVEKCLDYFKLFDDECLKESCENGSYLSFCKAFKQLMMLELVMKYDFTIENSPSLIMYIKHILLELSVAANVVSEVGFIANVKYVAAIGEVAQYQINRLDCDGLEPFMEMAIKTALKKGNGMFFSHYVSCMAWIHATMEKPEECEVGTFGGNILQLIPILRFLIFCISDQTHLYMQDTTIQIGNYQTEKSDCSQCLETEATRRHGWIYK